MLHNIDIFTKLPQTIVAINPSLWRIYTPLVSNNDSRFVMEIRNEELKRKTAQNEYTLIYIFKTKKQTL
jgi:hypothetical protein